MTIKNFIETVGKEKNKKMSVILETKKYLPIAEKRVLAQQVLDACVEYRDGVIFVDSMTKYLIFTMKVIGAYTNLEFEVLDDYDALCEADLLNPVIETFATEYARVNDILNMMLADMMQANTVEVGAMKLMNKVNDSLDVVVEALVNKIEEMDASLSDIRPDMVDSVVKLFNASQNK